MFKALKTKQTPAPVAKQEIKPDEAMKVTAAELQKKIVDAEDGSEPHTRSRFNEDLSNEQLTAELGYALDRLDAVEEALVKLSQGKRV